MRSIVGLWLSGFGGGMSIANLLFETADLFSWAGTVIAIIGFFLVVSSTWNETKLEALQERRNHPYGTH